MTTPDDAAAPHHPGPTPLQLWQLREMYIKDRRLEREPLAPDLSESLPGLAEAIEAAGVLSDVVYTAFDGDLFELAAQMRAYVLRQRRVPANPESIVGYHDSVRCHGNRKDLVLADDLAILNRCDALWVFTDVAPTAGDAAALLAEGVLVELLFHLARRERAGRPAQVLFIPTANLFGDAKDAVPYEDGYAATRQRLGPDQAEILHLLDRVGAERERPDLPPVAYIVHDPLDAKHVHWLRPFAYSRSVVPLVPTLALELTDAQLVWPPEEAPAQAMIARLRLLRLADELWILPPQQGRPESYTVRMLRHLWHGDPAERTDKAWSEMDIPKATSAGWHLTRREASAQHA
jgi:hypothetical protein